MHPFPTPPPFWETQDGVIAIFVALMVLSFGILGGIVLRKRHKPRLGDVVAWFVVGIVLTITFTTMAADMQPIRGITQGFLHLLWIGVVFGSWWSWLRWHDKDDRTETIVSIWAMLLIGSLLLSCLMFPSLVTPPEVTWRTQCRNNLHDIGRALHDYHDHVGSFPPQAGGQPAVSWRVSLLPFLDQVELHNDYDPSAAWDLPQNLTVARQPVREYTCPSVPEGYRDRDGLHFTGYAVGVGPHSPWQGVRTTNFGFITDGSSQTLLVVEACGQQIAWTEPRDIDLGATPVGINLPGSAEGRSEGLISSYHSGGAHVLMADGAVNYVSKDVDPKVLEALTTADGGDEAEEF